MNFNTKTDKSVYMVVGGTCHDGTSRTYPLEEILTEKKIYNTCASAVHTASCFFFFLGNKSMIQCGV